MSRKPSEESEGVEMMASSRPLGPAVHWDLDKKVSMSWAGENRREKLETANITILWEKESEAKGDLLAGSSVLFFFGKPGKSQDLLFCRRV